jgi:hypothetical protein
MLRHKKNHVVFKDSLLKHNILLSIYTLTRSSQQKMDLRILLLVYHANGVVIPKKSDHQLIHYHLEIKVQRRWQAPHITVVKGDNVMAITSRNGVQNTGRDIL